MRLIWVVILLLIGPELSAQWFPIYKSPYFAIADSLYESGNTNLAIEHSKECYNKALEQKPIPDTALMIPALQRLCNFNNNAKEYCEALYYSDLLFDLAYAKDTTDILFKIPGFRCAYREGLRNTNIYCERYQEKAYQFQITRFFKVISVSKDDSLPNIYKVQILGGSEERINKLAGSSLILVAEHKGKRREYISAGHGEIDWMNQMYSQWKIELNNIKDSAYLPKIGDLLECRNQFCLRKSIVEQWCIYVCSY